MDAPTSSSHDDWARRFGGIGRLYGEAALARFQRAHVCVIGVGGVGSWAAEALARSAIGELTLIDPEKGTGGAHLLRGDHIGSLMFHTSFINLNTIN